MSSSQDRVLAPPGATRPEFQASPRRLLRRRSASRVPPNLFGIGFGLAGLGEVWHVAQMTLSTPDAVPDAINVLAGAVWLATLIGYAAQGWRRVWADLQDSVLAPFVSLASITPLLLAAALGRENLDAGKIVVAVLVAVTVSVGGWFTGHWILRELDQRAFHPGYFLPTVAGGLIGAASASSVGLHRLGEASFGIGFVCWLLLGSIMLNRLFFLPRLTPPLVPTMAIELAPPAVAGLAYFALTRGAQSGFSDALAGYAVLMALVQVRLVPIYLKLRFSPGFWAFTFTYAAAASYALEWIAIRRPAGATGYSVAIVALISTFIVVIGARTVALAFHRKLLTKPGGLGSAAGLGSVDEDPRLFSQDLSHQGRVLLPSPAPVRRWVRSIPDDDVQPFVMVEQDEVGGPESRNASEVAHRGRSGGLQGFLSAGEGAEPDELDDGHPASVAIESDGRDRQDW